MLNISQSKIAKGKKLRKKGEEAGYARYGRREVWTPCPLSTHSILPKRKIERWTSGLKEPLQINQAPK